MAISTAYYCSNVVCEVKLFFYILCAVQETESSRADVMLDVDPEIIRKGVRTLMQQVAQIERERVSYSLQLVHQSFVASDDVSIEVRKNNICFV